MSPTPLTQAGWACSLWWHGCACCPLEACTVGEAPLHPAPLRQRPALRPANAAYGAVLQRRAVTSRLDTPPRSSSRIRRSTAAGRHLPLYVAAAPCMRADHGPARRRRRPAQRPQQTHALLERPACDAASTTSPARAGEQSVCGCRTTARSGQALRTFVATGCEAANYEAPAVQRWRSELPPRGYCWLLHRGQPLQLRVAGFWMPASAHQQPTQRRRPAHTSSERRRSTLSGSDTVTTATGNICGRSQLFPLRRRAAAADSSSSQRQSNQSSILLT